MADGSKRKSGDSVTPLVARLRALADAVDNGDAQLVHDAAVQVVEEAEELGGILDERCGALSEPQKMSVRQARTAGLRPIRSQTGERHDRKRVPSGYRYEDGQLLEALASEPERRRAAHLALLLISRFASMIEILDERGRRIDTATSWIQDVESFLFRGLTKELSGQPWTLSVPLACDVERIHLAFGTDESDSASPSWARQLESELQCYAEYNAQARLRAEHGHEVLYSDPTDPGERPERQTGEAMLDGVLNGIDDDCPPPSELTPQLIEEMKCRVSLNGRGRGKKKTARALVDELLDRLKQEGKDLRLPPGVRPPSPYSYALGTPLWVGRLEVLLWSNALLTDTHLGRVPFCASEILSELKADATELGETLPAEITVEVIELWLASVRAKTCSASDAVAQLVSKLKQSGVSFKRARHETPSRAEATCVQTEFERVASELCTRASQLDEDPSTIEVAEGLYHEAIRLDPKLARAYTNLGNIRFRRQDSVGAEELYSKALEIDARQPEAQYNIGYVMLERREAARSITFFRGAIEADPRFSDAYFNLGIAYEQIGESQQARPYWRRYIELEPSGPWTQIAKRRLVESKTTSSE